ncbi:MAG: glycogen synthase [Thermoguttaceae bacterium]|nr:glycogen synthase [Thermoguttaceae bacterium]
MNIVFVSSEAAPFAKTGGLADVCSALPATLQQLGHQVSVFLPAYRQIYDAGIPIETTGMGYCVPVGTREVWGEILKSTLPGSEVPVYFVRHDRYFFREGLYNSNGVDYQDNCERFIFFCRSVFRAIELLNIPVEILHANDWQTGLVPAYLATLYQNGRALGNRTELFGAELYPPQEAQPNRFWNKVRSVFTIHNMRHQGRFMQQEMELTGIDWKYFTFDKMEFYGQLNLLKTGITFADAITTVSPEYAKEIQTDDFGESLQGVLRYRSEAISGILNGIDTAEWNPETDPALAAAYNTETVFEKKPLNKAALQRECGLPESADTPLLGVVSRFDWQKGLDLVADVIPHFVESRGAQFVILGTGDPELERRFTELAARYPNNVAALIKFNSALSHQVEAGLDIFLMPSRYEPCGLNQMYSQRYGTLPLVRHTGGLADTVVGASDETIANRTANGFMSHWGTSDDLQKTVDWAIHCYDHRKEDWRQMILTAMKIDHSWRKSAGLYADLYERIQMLG